MASRFPAKREPCFKVPKEKKPKPRKPIPRSQKKIKAGKRTNQWTSTRAKLKKEFIEKSIDFCELCGNRFGLGFSHRMKRRYIVTRDELEIVVLLCSAICHSKVENMEPEKKKAFHDEVIQTRAERYWAAC